MSTRRLWIACLPEVRTAVNAALLDLAGGPVMTVQYPQPAEPFGDLPEPVIYVAGWQDEAATLGAVEAALASMAGVVAIPGVPDGLADDSAGEDDPAVGSTGVMRSRAGAHRYACAALGVTLTDAELGLGT